MPPPLKGVSAAPGRWPFYFICHNWLWGHDWVIISEVFWSHISDISVTPFRSWMFMSRLDCLATGDISTLNIIFFLVSQARIDHWFFGHHVLTRFSLLCASLAGQFAQVPNNHLSHKGVWVSFQVVLLFEIQKRHSKLSKALTLSNYTKRKYNKFFITRHLYKKPARLMSDLGYICICSKPFSSDSMCFAPMVFELSPPDIIPSTIINTLPWINSIATESYQIHPNPSKSSSSVFSIQFWHVELRTSASQNANSACFILEWKNMEKHGKALKSQGNWGCGSS